MKHEKWSKSDIEFATRMKQYKIKDARKLINNIDNDPDKERRTSLQECKVCYYVSSLAGQAFTNSNCKFCDDEMMFSNTNVDKLCQRCAIMLEACKHCGGEMDK